MREEVISEEKNNYIFTDSYRTKDLIWEAYSGFVEHYNNYIMYQKSGVMDPIVELGLIKYTNYFYEEIELFLKNFKFTKEEQPEEIRIIINKEKMVMEDYKTLRKFFNEFMVISGIKDIVKGRHNPDDAIERGMFG